MATEKLESYTIQRTENPDSLEIGTPGKGGTIKIYSDFCDKEGFRKKIDNAIELLEYARVAITPEK